MATILVVDDEQSVRNAVRKILERGGMTVLEARSAVEAFEAMDRGETIDAVVSDVLMPEMSGLSFYDELLKRSPGLKGRVVFLTGAAQDPKVHGPIENRGVPLISKMDDLMLVQDALKLALLRK